MDPIEVGSLSVAVIINFGLIGFVYSRNPRSATHRLFALLALVMSLWSITNFFAVNASSHITALWLTRGVMFFATPLSVLFFLLVHTFPRSTLSLSRRALAIWITLTVLTMATALSPWLFTEVEMVPGGAPKPTPGPGMLLFVPVGIGTIPLGFFYLFRKYRRARGLERTQLQFLSLGVITMFTLIIALNFLSVVIFKTSAFNQFGPLFTLPFTILAAYTIVRHRLLDIRLAIARSLSFTGLLGAFFILYAIILIFGVPLAEDILNIPANILAAIGALFAVVLARYVQDVFKRVTDRFLFQGRANYQAALARLGQELSRTIEIREVTNTVLRAMRDIVRVQKTTILLQDVSTRQFSPHGFDGLKSFRISIPHDHLLIRYFQRHPAPLVRDELRLQQEQLRPGTQLDTLRTIDNAFEWLDVAAILPLFVKKELTGLILLGEKLSGEPYLHEDVEFLSAFASQAATALENARLYRESLEFGQRLQREVERATHELAVANEQLKDLDKAKSEFLSIASHQLYTPLTALRGYLSMLREGDFGPMAEKQTPVLDILEKSANRLIILIKNLLDISRIEAGRLELKLESVDLAELAKQLVQELMPNAMAKKLDLQFHLPTDPVPTVVADRDRLRQVLLNFIDNAIKYTSRGRIEVSVAARGDSVICSVSDTGKGLARHEIEKLFRKFTRVGGSDRLRTEGAGLGLYVARQIVREHHGEVKAESPGLGKGSTFSVILPAEGTPHSLTAGQRTLVEIKAAESSSA